MTTLNLTCFTDVAELLSLVLQVGQEVEASSKLLDTMSEVVKRGIEAAQTDLERENAEKLWQEGILRHVPVVGTFVNWWSPPPKEGGVRGRSLNLQAGKPVVLIFTDAMQQTSIYRVHFDQFVVYFFVVNFKRAKVPCVNLLFFISACYKFDKCLQNM